MVEYYLCLLFPLNGYSITPILAVPFHVIMHCTVMIVK